MRGGGELASAQSLPEVSITAQGDVTEGDDASFTVTASEAPSADLTIAVTVNDWPFNSGVVAFGQAGSRTVTILGGETTAVLTVGTDADAVEEPRAVIGAVLDTPSSSAGYTLSSAADYDFVIVSDPSSLPVITIAHGGSVTEGGTSNFVITAAPVPTSTLTVNVAVSQTGTFGATGAATVTVSEATTHYAVSTTDDGWDEPHGYITATVLPGADYTVGQPSSGMAQVWDNDAPGQIGNPVITISSGIDISEGGAGVFTIHATQAPTSPLTITITSSQDGDFGASGAETVELSGTTASYTITTVDDSQDESDGSISATVEPGSGYDVGAPSSASISVADNDVPEVSITRRDQESRPSEGESAIFVLSTSSMPQQAITVNLDITATGDFGVQTGARSVTIPSSGNGSLLFRLPTIDDSVDEADGTVTATVQTGNGYTVGTPDAATLPVLDDDVPEISIIAGADVTEGGAASFTISASPTPHQPLPVDLNVAAAGDFGVTTGARTVSVPTSGSATLSLPTTNDSVQESNGSVSATVQSGSGYHVGSLSSASVSVADDDGSSVSISADGDITEGGAASFTISASPAPAQPMDVSLKVVTVGEFGITTGARTVSVPTSGSATLSLPTTNDSLDEPDGSVSATVQPGTDYHVGSPSTARVNVADDEVTPPENSVLTISAGNDVTEGQQATFTITQDPPSSVRMYVIVAAEVEGKMKTGNPAGVWISGATATLTVSTRDDRFNEASSTLKVRLVAHQHYTLGDPSQASLTILDNDTPKVVIDKRGQRGVALYEGGEATFSVSANPLPYQDLTVYLDVAAKGDFGVQTGAMSVTVPGGKGASSSVNFSIPLVDDTVHEDDGSVTVSVEQHNSYLIGAPSSGTFIITDDDMAPGPQVSIMNPMSKARPGETLVFPVTLDAPATSEVSVEYTMGRFSPLLFPGLDFQDDHGRTSGTLTFAAGETETMINVHIGLNAQFNHNDMIYIQLSDPVGGSIAKGWARGRLDAR